MLEEEPGADYALSMLLLPTDQKPEARAAARQAALAAGKQKKAAAQEAKKSSKVGWTLHSLQH